MVTCTGLFISGNISETGRAMFASISEQGYWGQSSAGSVSYEATKSAVSMSYALVSINNPVVLVSLSGCFLSICSADLLNRLDVNGMFHLSDTTKRFIMTEV